MKETRSAILVTGPSGFIGANLVRELLRDGHRLRGLDNFSSGHQSYLSGLDIEVVRGDVLDLSAVKNAMRGITQVVHLAAQTGVPGSLKDPVRDCQVNVMGTLNLLEVSREAGVNRFVFASSNAPMGRQESPASENKAPLPVSPYGASKLAGEGYCLAYHGSWGLGSVVLRFANVYGPYSLHKHSVVAAFCKRALSSGEILVDGDGSQTRDFIHVADLCRAVRFALRSDIGGEVFQIATGVETSIQDLANHIQMLSPSKLRLTYGPARRSDVRRNFSDVGKAREILGWTPRIGLKEGLDGTFKWFSRRAPVL